MWAVEAVFLFFDQILTLRDDEGWLLRIHFQKSFLSWVWWCFPVILAAWEEATAGGSQVGGHLGQLRETLPQNEIFFEKDWDWPG